MATNNLIPGSGFVSETETKQNLVPGAGFVNETVVTGGTTQTITCNVASGVADGIASTVNGIQNVSCSVASAVADGVQASVAEINGTLTLTDIDNLRVFQRNGTSLSITFSGTYTGAPTAIQARIVEDGTSTEVVTWTTIDAAPAGGTFSGSLSVPQGGWYNVQVRFSNNTGVVDNGTNKFGVGITVLCIGQSNIAQWFGVGSSTSPALASKNSGAVESTSTAATWAAIGTSSQGAAAFASNLISQYSLPVGMFAYAVGGTAISQWNDKTDPYYANAIKAVTDNGGGLEYVLWVQGEADALAGTTQATYESRFNSLVSNLRSDLTNRSTKTNLPVLVSLLGRGETSSLGSDASGAAIRAAQLARIAALDDVYLGATTHDLDLADAVHYTAAEYARHANRMAQTVKYLLGSVTYHRGPEITSAIIVDATTIDVLLTHRGGTDFTPTSGINGFEVLEAGTPVTLSSTARQDATTIRITLSSALVGGAVTVRHMYGIDGGVTFASTYSNEVVDNSALTLPLEGNAGTVANIVITCNVGSGVAAGVTSAILGTSIISCLTGDAIALGVAADIQQTLVTRTVMVTLQNRTGVLQTNLSSLKWAFFDEATPDLFNAPSVKGSAETTDSGGILQIDVLGTSLSPGQVGWLVITDSDGSVATNHKAFAGPVTVS